MHTDMSGDLVPKSFSKLKMRDVGWQREEKCEGKTEIEKSRKTDGGIKECGRRRQRFRG